MKNIVITILALTTIVVGYVAATSKLRLSLEGLEGKTEKLVRGDLTLPINATGMIRPFRRVQIKPEASGEVVDITRRPGERVAAGELLIRLQPDDEQRAVNRAELELDRSRARLEELKLIYEQTRTVDIKVAEAQLAEIEASLQLAKFRAERVVSTPDAFHEEERLQRLSAYEGQKAKRAQLQAMLDKAELAIPRMMQTVKQAEASYKAIRQTLGDAEKRLEKTDVMSPINGIVADIRTSIGEVVQGGKTTIGGGTVIAVVIDMSQLRVQAEVDEADIGRVLAIAPDWAKPGHHSDSKMPTDLAQAAATMPNLPEITVESFPDDTFLGIIERIYPEPITINNVTTYPVDVIILGNHGDKLLPGMRADIRFTSEHVDNVVLCPNEAIREGPSGGMGVFIPDPNALAEERKTKFIPCRFGIDNGNYSEVRDGLREGMTVYTKLPVHKSRKKKASS